MNLNKVKKYLIISLVLFEVCVIHLAYKSFNNKPVKLPEVQLKEENIKKSNGFAIMLNEGDGSYKESSEGTFPKVGYIYNADKSGCMDSSGKAIADSLTYDNSTHNVRVRTKGKLSCYLYFDKKDVPIIDKFYINDETSNKTTKVPEVTLYLKWSDSYIKEYCISETQDIDSCSWQTTNGVTEITSNYTFTEQTTKTFYAYIKDMAEGVSEVKSDSIEYNKPPTAGDIATNPPAETTDGGGAITGVAQDELEMRYYGKNPANYICFGTTNKTECTSTSGQDKYMYRIIGVTKDKGKGRMFKLIKKEALNSTGRWYSNYTTDIKWPQSEVYSQINGSTFLTNTTYMPDGWSNKIEDVNWKYGDFTDNNKTATQIVQIEQAWNTTVSAKIGLMYMADYYFAYQKSGLNCSYSGQYSTCKTSWMHFLNNDSGAPNSSYEWTMSRYGFNGSYYLAWPVYSDGNVSTGYLNNTRSVRPVFYLKSDVAVSGSGTISDPYMIVS